MMADEYFMESNMNNKDETRSNNLILTNGEIDIVKFKTRIEDLLTNNFDYKQLNSIISCLQDHLWNLAYNFKNEYDKYVFDNFESLQNDSMKWFKTYQYVQNVIVPPEEKKLLAYICDFMTTKNFSSNFFVMYAWNQNPDFDALSSSDKFLLHLSKLYHILNDCFIVRERIRRLENIKNN